MNPIEAKCFKVGYIAALKWVIDEMERGVEVSDDPVQFVKSLADACIEQMKMPPTYEEMVERL